MADTVVAADLKVTDLASATLNRVKGGFGAVNKEFDHARSSITSFLKNSASTALGLQLAGIIPTMKNLAGEAFEAALAAGKEEKAIAATLMMTDRKDRSYVDLRKEAGGLREELRNMGMAAGVSGDSVVESFNDIAARSTKSTSQIKDLMKSFVQAGRIAPGGLASITQGFEMMELGMVRARNPVVQMIASTGLLKGNAREVAKQLQKMGPDKMMEIAEQAINRMATKMKDVPLSYGETMQSMKDMREELMLLIGRPILKGITPALRTIHEAFDQNMGNIEHFFEGVGVKAGEGIKYAIDAATRGVHELQANWDTISSTISTAASALQAAASFVVSNAGTIAKAFGSHQTMGVSTLVSAFAGKGENGGNAGDILGTTGAAVAGGAKYGVLGATAAGATAAVGNLIEQIRALAYESENRSVEGIYLRATAASNATRNAELQKENALLGKRASGNDHFIKGTQDMMEGYRQGQRGSVGMVPEIGFKDMIEAGLPDQAFVSAEALKAAQVMTMGFNQMFTGAAESGNQAAVNAAIQTLAGSQQLQYALMNSGIAITGGFEALAKAAEEGGDLASAAMFRSAANLQQGAGGKAAPKVSVGGGNTVNVKQEFREADPDRIMLAFKEGITKAATSRLNARVSSPFGSF